MKKSSLILLNLIAVLEMKSIEARYVLIEVVQEQAMLGQSRDLKYCLNERSYECRPEATAVSLGNTQSVMSCALRARFPNGSPGHYKEGNYMIYDITHDGSHDRLEIQEVVADCCEPKPELCHCNVLLRRVLLKNPKVDRIDGQFAAIPFMAGCRCYLRVAADFGFKWIEDCDDVNSPRVEFTKTNYVQVCEKLRKRKCERNARIYKV